MKSDNLVEDIKARLDIVELISEHVELKRSGSNFKGLCPFHAEKTPSFMVSPAKQIFHCFGCSKGGDIFGFTMGYENMDFSETLSFLADKAGLNIDEYRGAKTDKGIKENVLAAQVEALNFFRQNLSKSKQAKKYLEDRGVSEETAAVFSLGYTISDRDALYKKLKAKGLSDAHIKASGLVNFGERGPYDFFRDRLMFPIFDLQGKPIAFGGRTFSSSKEIPKYINSPDSPVFRKGETCFSLDKAKSAIVQKKYSVIVEGYLDAIMCHQHGIANVVAPLGTALTAGQVKRLKRFAEKVVLVFDGDSAGISATKRALSVVFGEGLQAKVLILPEGEDPDSYLKKHGAEKFRKLMAGALSPVNFLLKYSGSNRLDAVRLAIQSIAACADSLQRDELVRELGERSGVSELTLRQELKTTVQKTFKNSGQNRNSGRNETHIRADQTNKEELLLLNIMLTMPEKAYDILHGIEGGFIENTVIRAIFDKAAKFIKNKSQSANLTNALLDVCSDDERVMITKHSISHECDIEHADTAIEDCISKIKLREIEKKIKEAELKANETGDLKELSLLLTEKNEFNNKRMLRGQG
ncbi:MAG: DNA primase [Nitrospirae bacterium]|nr:DNA primase [Nitrospirota bacterium]